jgi:hypothetical protein
MSKIERIFELVGKLPTIQTRIAVTLLIWQGTAIWVWAGGDLQAEFAALIAIMSGVDAAAYHSKRATFKPGTVSVQNGNVAQDEIPNKEEKG